MVAVRDALWLRPPRDPKTDAWAEGCGGGRCSSSPSLRCGRWCPRSMVPPQGISAISSDPSVARFSSAGRGWFALIGVFVVFNTGARRGAAVPGLAAAAHASRLRQVGLGRQRGAVHPLSPARAVGHAKTLVEGIFLEAYPTRRLQSAWMGIIVQSAKSVFVIAIVLTLVLK